MKKQEFILQPIGYVESSFTELKDCPFQGNETCPPAIIHIESGFTPGLMGLEPGQDILVLTFLDKSGRDTLQCRPRNDPNNPLRGVFATRSPNRPNPVGLHQVKIISIKKDVLVVRPLEVLDKTPVIDIKPVLADKKEHSLYRYFSKDQVNTLINCSIQACAKGLLNGLNGNLSIRNEDHVLITRSGSAKGLLGIDDLCVVELKTGKILHSQGKPSTESGMHLEIYKNQPEAGAIAHTHPVSILSLERLKGDCILESVDLFESRALKSQLASVPDHRPGTTQLAKAVGLKAKQYKCVLMKAHGLTCWGESLPQAAGLCDELEALAQIELNALRLGSLKESSSPQS
ncbi:MAG: tRNA (N6-threonylcarbamoyladenosine(37)-N6)-methyltransferase TrmO [Desulfonatronovibrio sp.]